jgi:hypothetical protein
MMRNLNVIVPELVAAYEELLAALDAQGPNYVEHESARVDALIAELARDHGMTFEGGQ